MNINVIDQLEKLTIEYQLQRFTSNSESMIVRHLIRWFKKSFEYENANIVSAEFWGQVQLQTMR